MPCSFDSFLFLFGEGEKKKQVQVKPLTISILEEEALCSVED